MLALFVISQVPLYQYTCVLLLSLLQYICVLLLGLLALLLSLLAFAQMLLCKYGKKVGLLMPMCFTTQFTCVNSAKVQMPLYKYDKKVGLLMPLPKSGAADSTAVVAGMRTHI